MTGNVVFTPSLQAPVSVSNPTGDLSVVGTGGIGQNQIVTGSGDLSLLGASSRLDAQSNLPQGTLGVSSAVSSIISGIATQARPPVASLSYAGALAIISGAPATGSPTFLIRADGVAQNGVPAYTSLPAAKSAGVVFPGSIGEIQANNPNVAQTINGGLSSALDLSGLNGSANALITVRFAAGHSFVLLSSKNTVQAINSSYWVLDMSRAHVTIGGPVSAWSPPTSGTGWSASSQQNGIYLQQTQHFKIFGTVGWDPASIIYGGQQYVGNMVLASCSYGLLSDLDFYLQGSNAGGAPGPNNEGNTAVVAGSHMIVRRCRSRLGGHDTYESPAVMSIHDGCVFGNYWPSAPKSTGQPGSRCSEMSPITRATVSEVDTTGPVGPPFGPNLYFGNQWNDANHGVSGIDYMMTKADMFAGSFIGNYFLDNSFGAVMGTMYIGGDGITYPQQQNSFLRVLHNTGFSVRGVVRCMDQWKVGNQTGNNVYPFDFERHRNSNNIWSDVNLNIGPWPGIVRIEMFWGPTPNTGKLGTYANTFKGGCYGPNIFVMSPGFSAGADQVFFYDTNQHLTQFTVDQPPAQYSAPDALTNLPNVSGWIRCTRGSGTDNSKRIDFADVGSAPARSQSGFSLVGPGTAATGTAPGITFSESASTGSVVTVNDPWALMFVQVIIDMIADGFLTEAADYWPYIAIGQTPTDAANNIHKVVGVSALATQRAGQWTLADNAQVSQGDQIWFAGLQKTPRVVWDNYGASQQ